MHKEAVMCACNKSQLIRKWIIFGRPDKKTDMVTSAKITKELHSKYSNAVSGIECFKDTFSLWVKEVMKPYQALPSHVMYALQEPF